MKTIKLILAKCGNQGKGKVRSTLNNLCIYLDPLLFVGTLQQIGKWIFYPEEQALSLENHVLLVLTTLIEQIPSNRHKFINH